MTDFLIIPPNERHTLRVFALDLTLAEVAALRDMDAVLHPGQVVPPLRADAAQRLLGVPVDVAQVDVFHSDDVEAIGLAAYLIEGNAVTEAQIAADADLLDAYRGYVMAVRSQAFGGQAATLTPDPKLRLMGTYTEETPAIRFETLPAQAAKGVLAGGRAPKSDARIGGMVATFVLLFLAIFTVLMIWIAG
ncbi:MAG: hypothetical protein RLZZ437_2424 [Pseudomonadota bacterium]|jgi:hypothetical protein